MLLQSYQKWCYTPDYIYLDLQAEIQPHFNRKMSSGYACLIIWIIAIATLSWVSVLTLCQPFPAVQLRLGTLCLL